MMHLANVDYWHAKSIRRPKPNHISRTMKSASKSYQMLDQDTRPATSTLKLSGGAPPCPRSCPSSTTIRSSVWKRTIWASSDGRTSWWMTRAAVAVSLKAISVRRTRVKSGVRNPLLPLISLKISRSRLPVTLSSQLKRRWAFQWSLVLEALMTPERIRTTQTNCSGIQACTTVTRSRKTPRRNYQQSMNFWTAWKSSRFQ